MTERIMPEIDQGLCTLCGDCILACPTGAASLAADGQIVLAEERCAYCGDCEEICPVEAIKLPVTVVLLNTDRPRGDDDDGQA
jgi:ferredoxin